MTTNEITDKQPLWLLIEEKILALSSGDLEAGKLEQTIHHMAKALDDTGHNVSKNGGNLLQLRWALDARIKVGKAMMEDFNAAVSALKLEDVTNPRKATASLTNGLADTWPELREYARKADVLQIVEKTRLDLYIARAKELGGEEGIRYLIADGVASEVIIDRMNISEEEFARVNAAVEAELAEKARVKSLFEEAEGKSDEDKVKKLINENVTDELMIEICGFEQATNIPNDQILEYIESIREIMEFTEKEDEIRTMSEQSSIPKVIVDVAVSGPGELDKLEEKAGG
jgi:hypothetical protein